MGKCDYSMEAGKRGRGSRGRRRRASVGSAAEAGKHATVAEVGNWRGGGGHATDVVGAEEYNRPSDGGEQCKRSSNGNLDMR